MIYNITEQEYGVTRTQIKDFSDAETIENMYIDDKGRLCCREGLTQIHMSADAAVRGVFSCIIDGTQTLYFVAGTNLYSAEKVTPSGTWGSAAVLASLAGDSGEGEITMFKYAGNLYICGSDYYRWDGSTLSAVAGYVPLIRRYSSNTNLGQVWEPMNLLTNRVRMRFCPDGSSKKFKLYGSVASIDAVYFNGSQITSYTPIIGAASYVELNVIYATNEDDLLEVWYTLNKTSRRQKITSCPHAAVYGGEADTRVILYGGNDRSAMYFSEPDYLGDDSKTRAEYFPDDNIIALEDSNAVIKAVTIEPDCIDLITESNTTRYDMTYYESDGNAQRLIPKGSVLSDVCGSLCDYGAALIGKDIYTADYAGLWKIRHITGESLPVAESISFPAGEADNSFIPSCRMYGSERSGFIWLYSSTAVLIYDIIHACWYKYTGLAAQYVIGGADGEIIVSSDGSGDKISQLDKSVPCADSCCYTSMALDLGDAFELKKITSLGVSTIQSNETLKPAAVLVLDDGTENMIAAGDLTLCNSSDALPAVYSAALSGKEGYYLKLKLSLDAALGGLAALAVDSEAV